MRYLCLLLLLATACTPKTGEVVHTTTEPKDPVIEEVDNQQPEEDDRGEEEPASPYLLFSMKVGPCYGSCPVYQVEFWSDKSVKYRGKRFVEREGDWFGRMSDQQFAALKREIKSADYFNLAKSYPDNGHVIEDLPTTVTAATLNGKTHEIINNHGAPKVLTNLQKYVHALLDELAWRGAPEKN